MRARLIVNDLVQNKTEGSKKASKEGRNEKEGRKEGRKEKEGRKAGTLLRYLATRGVASELASTQIDKQTDGAYRRAVGDRTS